MIQNLVSVIIPTYNRAQQVSVAIKSALAQSYPFVQVIVIDDGSEDDTKQIVAQFEGLEYYRQENKGQAAARNLGLKYAMGEYIASLDSDDVWDEDFLKVAITAMENYQTDFVALNWTEIRDGKSSISHWHCDLKVKKFLNNLKGDWIVLNPQEVRELFINICPSPSSSLVIRTSSFVSNWNVEMKIADDWYLILEMVLKKSCRAAFSPTPHWMKYIHKTNIYHGRDELEVTEALGLHDEQIFAEDFKEYLTSAEKAVLKKRSIINHLNFGRLKWRRNRFSLKALLIVLTAFKLNPIDCIHYLKWLTFNHFKNRFRIARLKKPLSNKS